MSKHSGAAVFATLHSRPSSRWVENGEYMIKAMLVIVILFISGCAGLITGTYPFPTGIEVAPRKQTMAKINTEDFEAFQEIEGYFPDYVLVGFVVPFIPIGSWKWLSGTSKDDLRGVVDLWIKPKRELALVDTATLHIDVNGRMYSPTEIKMNSMCGVDKDAVFIDTSKPVKVTKKACIWFRFANLQPPSTSFTVVAAGLPSVKYLLVRKTRYEFIWRPVVTQPDGW